MKIDVAERIAELRREAEDMDSVADQKEYFRDRAVELAYDLVRAILMSAESPEEENYLASAITDKMLNRWQWQAQAKMLAKDLKERTKQ